MMRSKPCTEFASLTALGVIFAVLSAYLHVSGDTADLNAAIAARLKNQFKLGNVVTADRNERSRASGVIKEEDEKEGYLLLLTQDICKEEGASGIMFINPYKKTKLEEPADCDGTNIDRYMVEQEVGEISP